MNNTFKMFDTNTKMSWCPGCGDFSILLALKQAMFDLKLTPYNTVIVSGIGQAAKTPQYVNANGYNSLHGRALPPALGMHVANKDLNIFVTSGDGDSYGEGGNHFIHNIRRNPDIVHIVYNNRVYGLTKGQGSPTTDLGQRTSMQLEGSYVPPLNPITLALTMGAGFVARAYAGNREQLVELIKKAHDFKGYALIDVLQPCPSFNRINTPDWYKEKTYTLKADYNHEDFFEAYKVSLDVTDHIALGLIYSKERRTFLESLPYYSDSLINRNWKAENTKELFNDFI